MTPQEDLRKRAQQLRQATRTELAVIRKAQMAQRQTQEATVAMPDPLRAPQGPGADRLRRLRRAKRLAGLPHPIQDAHLAVAMEAGLIELWTEGGQVDSPQGRVPDLIDHCPQENFDTVAAPRDAVSPDALREFFGPHLPLTSLTAGPHFIGPLWQESAAAGHGEALDPTDHWIGHENADPDVTGTDAQTAYPAGRDAGENTGDQTHLPLTLSLGMRVDRPDPAATDPRGPDAVDPAPPPDAVAGADGLLAPNPDDDLARGQDRLVAALLQTRQGGPGSNLSSLPGAGPGLIWMLQKCGIETLQDLALADPALLVPRLGLVGKIADVHGWHRYAQRQVAQVS